MMYPVDVYHAARMEGKGEDQEQTAEKNMKLQDCSMEKSKKNQQVHEFFFLKKKIGWKSCFWSNQCEYYFHSSKFHAD